MKGKVLTSWSLIWLLATVLFVAGGALNLSQRAYHQPAADRRRRSGRRKRTEFMPKRSNPDLPASRAGISVGDKLIGIGLDE